jgi:hypothetical protein
MTDSSAGPHTGGMEVTPERSAPAGMPRWVKVSLIIAVALVLLFVVGKLTGLGGEHGPGRHGNRSETPSTVVSEDGRHRPPVDHGP